MQNSFAGRAAPGKTIFVAGCWLEYPWTVLHLKGGALMRAAFLLSIILMEKSTVLFARLSAPRTTKPAVAPCRHHPLTPLPLLHLPLDTGRHSDPITVSSPMRTGLTQLTTQPFLPRFSQCKLHSTPRRMLKFTITKQISFILACPSERLNTSTLTVQKSKEAVAWNARTDPVFYLSPPYVRTLDIRRKPRNTHRILEPILCYILRN